MCVFVRSSLKMRQQIVCTSHCDYSTRFVTINGLSTHPLYCSWIRKIYSRKKSHGLVCASAFRILWERTSTRRRPSIYRLNSWRRIRASRKRSIVTWHVQRTRRTYSLCSMPSLMWLLRIICVHLVSIN